MQYKLIILDVDGTLISKFKEPISPRVEMALRSAKDKGVKIALCTGKSLVNAMQYITQLGIEDSYSIVESGAKIIGPDLKIVKIESIPNDVVKEVNAKILPFAESGMCSSNGQWKEVELLEDSDVVTSMTFVCSKEKPGQEELVVSKVKELNTDNQFHYTVASHWEGPDAGSVVLITNVNASKFTAAEYIKNLYNFKTEDVIAVGDMPNDIPMLNSAGLKVAMGNGREDVKLIADYVCASVTEDGVAEVVEKFILNS